MPTSLGRRRFLTQAGIALAAVETIEHFAACCALAADSATAEKDLFELKQVGDGVYAAIAAPRYKVNCNAAVILTNDGVIVVDSHSKPTAALALQREIQSITKLPVRKIINTHFHWDHTQGNQAYAQANPKLEIIASERTRANLASADAGAGGHGYIEKQLAALPKEIEKLKDDVVRARDPEQKKRLEGNLRQTEAYYEELKNIKPPLPTRTLTKSVTLKEGGREIQILLLGRAHTDGDVFIYLPKEKVVATGDALIDWMPFMADGYPEEWVGTLDALNKLDFTHIIPGHGEVMPKAQLVFFRGYLLSRRSHRRREGRGKGRREPGGDEEDARRSPGAQVRAADVEASARAVPRAHRAQHRDGLPQGGAEGLSGHGPRPTDGSLEET
ncbi:MAG: MBL fold metallo-hydrolase [Deltaproteobacteria bacterium]|nr:MAG: MBL fold metallo-hydrolase [Deltaproteobacteria bacterium]